MSSYPPPQQPSQPPYGQQPPPYGQQPSPYGQQAQYGQPAPEPIGYGSQLQPQPQQGMGALLLNLKLPPTALGLSLIGATVKIDGHRATVHWGSNTIPVPAGHHRIEVQIDYLWTYGRASLDVMVQPGQQVPVHYSMPYITWSPGAIGHEPQPHNGLAWLLAVVGVPVAILLLVILFALIGAAAFS